MAAGSGCPTARGPVKPFLGSPGRAARSLQAEAKRAYYSVTERGRRRIEDVSPRIYGPGHRVGRPLADDRLWESPKRARIAPDRSKEGSSPSGLGLRSAPFGLDIAERRVLPGGRRSPKHREAAGNGGPVRSRYEGTPDGPRSARAMLGTSPRSPGPTARSMPPTAPRLESERNAGTLNGTSKRSSRGCAWSTDYRKFTYLDPRTSGASSSGAFGRERPSCDVFRPRN